MKKQNFASLAAASAFAAVALTPVANAADNPFSASQLQAGYQLAQADTKGTDGKCGAKKSDAKCGADKKADAKCGADKKSDAKCGADKKADAKCGADKKSADGKCGAAK